MKHTYHIHGMTCNGCRSHVEKTLSEVDGVSSASVDLEKAQATIEMYSHIALETFQKALLDDGGAYSIHRKKKYHKEREQALSTVPCVVKVIRHTIKLVIVRYAEWISLKNKTY